MKKVCIFIIPVLVVMCVAPAVSIKNVTTILAELTGKADPYVRPYENTGDKVEVSVSMYVLGFHAIDEASQEMALDMYMRYFWTDPRLQFSGGPSQIKVPFAVAKEKFWFPDLFFTGVRQQNLHGLLMEDAMVRLGSDGKMFISVRASIRFDCPMDLRSFPMDTQSCKLNMESYGHTSDELTLTFNKSAVTSNKKGRLVAFGKPDINQGSCSEQYEKYQCLYVEFVISRLSAHYIVMIYIPSFLLMILGGLVFWLPLGALFERTFFSAFLILSQATILAASQYGTPQVGYMKAIDVFVVASFIILSVVLLEVIVLFLLARNTSGLSTNSFEIQKDDDSTDMGQSQPKHLFFLQPTLVKRLDLVFRLAYPPAVLLFIVIYSCVYHT